MPSRKRESFDESNAEDTLGNIRVVKLGGSLLDLPDLATRFHGWIEQQTTAVHLVVVGGGALVEVVRDYDQQHAMDAAQVHWLCVDLLDVTARLAAQLLKLDLVETDQQLAMRLSTSNASALSPVVVSPSSFYARRRQPSTKHAVPESWQTTTDTIAGLLAIQVRARELVLLKSVTTDSANPQDWSRDGIVDQAFPLFSADVSAIRVVNLRDA